MSRQAIVVSALIAAVLGLTVVGVAVQRRRAAAATTAAAPPAAAPAPVAEKRITATLFFVSEDGMALVGVQREVPYGATVAEQARRLVESQLGAAPAPLASTVPEGTTLRALFLTESGDAFVDLSGTVAAKHTGGALDELFTVFAIVNALTVNLPTITRVQILIDGKESDTLAGHVDLRHPLRKNMKWVKVPE